MRFGLHQIRLGMARGIGCAIIATAIAASTQSASAATLLGVDFGATSSPVETGFQAFGAATGAVAGPFSKTFDSVTVTVAVGTTLTGSGNLTARDRTGVTADSGAFTYSELYRDFLNPSATNSLSIGISGLAPSTPYKIGFYAYDNSSSKTVTFTDFTTGSAGTSGAVAFTAATAFTSNDQYSTFLDVTTTASGNLVFRSTSANSALINALVIQSVPEPTSIALIGFGALALRRRGRRSPAGSAR